MRPTSVVVVETTLPQTEDAWRWTRSLVERRLAACANRLEARSAYWWKGRLTEDPEWHVSLKTTSQRAEALVAVVRDEHPYEVPMVLWHQADDVASSYASWVADEVSQGATSNGPPS